MTYASNRYTRSALKNGYTNRMIFVDLSTKQIEVRNIQDEMRDKFIGGRGYCLKLVYDGTGPATRYDSPENVLAFAGGPFCGETAFAGTGKFIVGTVSPLTQTFCDSNVGGHFFPLVKLAGFDAIAVTGRSESDLLVRIDGNRCCIEIVDAPECDGTLLDADHLVKSWNGSGRLENVSFICAGTGALNTHLGCINSVYYDVRRGRCRAKQAGRGGTGTVMRAKGLWGITVTCDEPRGNANRPADRKRLMEAGRKLRKVIREVDPRAMSLGTQGTTCLIDMMNAHHLLPINNFKFGMHDYHKHVSGDVFERDVFEQKHPDGCYAGCTLACTKGCEEHTLQTGPFAGRTVAVDGPEYETAAAVTNLGIFDVHTILEYAWYCDEYGLDTISTGVTMAFLIEAFERGLLTRDDTNGLDLAWNSPQNILELLHRMAQGQCSFAHAAGRGVRAMKGWIADRAASRNGRSRSDIHNELCLFAMESKGLEFSMYITKESLAQQGGYGFALKGPQHDEAWLIAIDQLNNELPTFKKKAVALLWFPLIRTWFNMVGLCKLPWIDVRHPDAKKTPHPARNLPTIEYYLELVNATLGTAKTLDDLLEESERCYLLHKLFNLRQGFGTRDHDAIPLRAMAPVFPDEFRSRKDYYATCLQEAAGHAPDGKSDEELLALLQDFRRAEYEKLTDVVYEEKGYDRNGIPFDRTLRRLGLDDRHYFDVVNDARKRI